MGKPVTSNAKRVETAALNTKINKEVFENFKDYCKELGYSMNVILETFMRQYANGRFYIDTDDILKWKKEESELEILSTAISKEIYINFKHSCKENRFYVKHVVTAFMEKIASRDFILEYTHIKDIKNDV